MDDIQKLTLLQGTDPAQLDFLTARYEHVRDRMLERWHFELTREEWQQLNLSIFLDKPGTNWLDMGKNMETSLYTVRHRGVDILCFFDEVKYLIGTVLPRTDPRILAWKNGRYETKAQSDSNTSLRDQRRASAARLDEYQLSETGMLVLPRRPVLALPEAKPANPFVEALSGFVASDQRPEPLVEEPAEPKPQPEAEAPALNQGLAARFALVCRHLLDQEQVLDADLAAAAEEVERLEARLAQLQAGDPVLDVRRDYLRKAREAAEGAWRRFQAGEWSGEAAGSVLAMMLAAVPAEAEPAPVAEPVVAPSVPASTYVPRGLRGISQEGPDATEVWSGKSKLFELDGVRDNLVGWARRAGITPPTIYNRMKKGASFRQALFDLRPA